MLFIFIVYCSYYESVYSIHRASFLKPLKINGLLFFGIFYYKSE